MNTVLGGLLGLTALKAIAVGTGPHADSLLGQLAFALGLAGTMRAVIELGLGAAHVRRVSEGHELGPLTASYGAAEGVLVAAYLAFAGTAVWVAAELGRLQDTPAVAVLLVAVYFALVELRSVFTASFEGRQEFAKSQLTVLAENVVRVGLTLVFAAAFAGAVLGNGPAWLARFFEPLEGLLERRDAELLAGCYAAAGLASFLAGLAQFRRGYPVGRPAFAVIRDYWSFGRHLLVVGIATGLVVSLDKVILTAFWAPEQTGRYFGAQRITDLIAMVPLAVYTVLFPALSRSYTGSDVAQARAALESALRHVSLVVVPLAAFVIALGEPLVSLVLSGLFAPAVDALRVLAVYSLLYALLTVYMTLLHARGRPDVTARAAVAGLVANLVLALLLVPPGLGGLAELGAAVAAVGGALVQLTVLRRATHLLEGAVRLGRLVRHVVAGAAAGGVLYVLAPPPEAAHWYVMLGLGALGLAVYSAGLAALGELSRRDLRMLGSLLDAPAMARYVADELKAQGPGGRRGRR